MRYRKYGLLIQLLLRSRRKRTLLSQIWSGEIGYGIWYEKYAAVEDKWLRLVNTILLELYSEYICFAVLGLCGFVGGVLRDLMK